MQNFRRPFPSEGAAVKQETLVISFLNELVRTPAAELDDAITRVLARLGDVCQADRAYVFAFRQDKVMDNTHEWVAAGVAPMRDLLQNLPINIIASWRDKLAADAEVHIPSVAALPDAAPEKATLQMQDILSVLVVPILVDGKVVGMAGLDRTRVEAAFSDDTIAMLRAVADVIQSALMRKEAVQDLERTKDKLELTLKALPDLLLEVDHDGIYRAFHHTRALGWAPEPGSVIGHRIEDILRPEVAAERRRMMAAARNGEAVVGVEQHLRPADPNSWVEVSVVLRDSFGPDDPGGYLFLIRDISERKAREAELAQAQAQLLSASAERDAAASRLHDLSDISDDWVWEQDASGRYTYMSHNVARFGVGPEFFIGRTREEVAAEIGAHGGEDSGFAHITAKMMAREPFRDLIYQARYLDGRPAFFRFSASPVFDANGTFTGYRGVGSDVTELRLREAAKLGFDAGSGPADGGQDVAKLRYAGLTSLAGLVDRVMATP